MRDREFELAKNALIEGTQDKSTLPESFALKGDGILYGKKGKVHTLVIGVALPFTKFERAHLRLTGAGSILDERDVQVDSWLRNHFNHAFSVLAATNANSTGNWGDGYLSGKDTGGTIRTGNAAYGIRQNQTAEGTLNRGYLATYGTETIGIQVGTDDTAVDAKNDYKLGARITHAQAPGEILYATSPKPSPHVWDGVDTFSRNLDRYFDNFSGGTITIYEIGLAGALWIAAAETNHLLARDVIAAGYAIPFRAQLKVTYTFELIYSLAGSPLRNMYNTAFSQQASLNADGSASFGNGQINLLDTGGTLRSGNYPIGYDYLANLHVAGSGFVTAAGNTNHGILVGNDSVSGVSFEDNALNSLITEGVAGGQLNYGLHETPVRNWSDPIFTCSHARIMTNNSAGAVTVRESGAVAYIGLSSGEWNALMTHETFSDVGLDPGESLRIVYQLKATYW